MLKWIADKLFKKAVEHLTDYKLTGNTTVIISSDDKDIVITIRCSNTKVEKI